MNLKDSYIHLGPGGNSEKALIKNIEINETQIIITRAKTKTANGEESDETDDPITIPIWNLDTTGKATKDGDGNITSATYLKLSGGTMTGSLIVPSIQVSGTANFDTTISGSISGNAATASALATSKKINGTSFNGTADITTSSWGTARNISIADSDKTNTGTAVSVNGSAAYTLFLPATIKATLTGTASAISNLTTSDVANSSDDWRKVWFSYLNGTTGRPALSENLTFQTSTGILKSIYFLGALKGNADTASNLSNTSKGVLYQFADTTTSVTTPGTSITTAKYLGATTDSSGNLSFVWTASADLVGGYWANLTTASSAKYNSDPEFATIKLGNGTTTTATSYCQQVYDSTNKCLKFVFA